MKKTFLAVALSAMTLGAANAATNMQELSSDLKIMSNILDTVLSQNNGKKEIQFRKLDVSYLADQGVVFEVHTGQGGFNFDFSFGNFNLDEFIHEMSPVGNAAPVPPSPPGHGEVESEVIVDIAPNEEGIRKHVRLALENVREAMEDSREHLRELREQQSELNWEQREYDRRVRDIEFERRHASKEEQKELDSQLQELEQERLALENQRKDIEKQANQLEEQQKQQFKRQQEVRAQQTKAFLAKFEDAVANVLCKYGAGIKSLPDDEHVSFVLNSFSQEARGVEKDKIYVFKNKDIKSCVTEKIDKNKLLTRVNTYYF